MTRSLLSAGEFASLARTSKRTILWYDQLGLLKPVEIDPVTRYRYYQPQQILDYQVIFLLTKMRFTLAEIKKYLQKNLTLEQLFLLKKPQIEEEIKSLQKSLSDLEGYYHNLKENQTLVDPVVKKSKPFFIYYLEKQGPYAKIKDYALELKSYFKAIPQNAIYLTLFAKENYNPKSAKLTIGVIKNAEMTIKKENMQLVKTAQIPGYRALSHMHYGSGAMISLLWKELVKYRRLKGFKLNSSLPFSSLELYWLTSLNHPMNENEMIFELPLPINKA